MDKCESFGFKKPENRGRYNYTQIKMGIKVEQEHITPSDPFRLQKARCITMHHLDEQIEKKVPQTYYTDLKKMEEKWGL